jgi:AraC family transcriptional regulator of adaptative response/methylated-DNA-[protein]-cysteine methyltransferase
LRDSASVLDAALDAGLSGPGRLHDLLVNLEAASPGEIKNGGAGLRIEWGMADSPFGHSSVGWNARGICHLAFHDDELYDGELKTAPAELRENWPGATLHRDDRASQAQANIIFHCEARPAAGLKAFVRGTPFQLQVWRALLRVPEGSVASYRAIARAVGAPKAARAVGAACGANPIAYLIPCHRVIRETGVVQGYRWGTIRKQALLARESVF